MALQLREFKEVFREARKAKPWTQERAARELGVTLRTIASWESGEKEPRLSHFLRMAEAFEWDLPFLSEQIRRFVRSAPEQRKQSVLSDLEAMVRHESTRRVRSA